MYRRGMGFGPRGYGRRFYGRPYYRRGGCCGCLSLLLPLGLIAGLMRGFGRGRGW